MKSRSTLPILLFSLLSCLSLAFSSPIPTRVVSPDDLVQRSTDYSLHEARSFTSQGHELPLEKRMLRTKTLATVAKAAVRMKSTVPAIAAPKGPAVSMVPWAQKILQNSGHTSKDYNGVHPETAHVEVTKGHFLGRPNIDQVKITAPFHEGGKGDAVRPPDQKNHLVAQPISNGKPLPKEHVYAPANFPAVDQSHFRSNTLPPQPPPPKPSPPTRSNTN